jgi:hypothetical protein
MDEAYAEARLLTAGTTDCGRPLYLFVIDAKGRFTPERDAIDGRLVVLINNGIHPGEPDGIDASLLLAKKIFELPEFRSLLDRLILAIVPVFNVDGALNRSCCSRANQDGPEAYGFRGNAQYLDLNRDFIKADAANTRSLIELVKVWQPDILIDTHVSDGADYAATMTLISSAADKLTPPLGQLTRETLTPEIFDRMQTLGDTACPYVDARNATGIPDSGIIAFLETPRFLSGWAALHHVIGFITESHMLKPFPQRVRSTEHVLEAILRTAFDHATEIREARRMAANYYQPGGRYPLNWTLDTTRTRPLEFSGYTARYKKSQVTGLNRLYYDHSARYRKTIPYFERYWGRDSVTVPAYYVLPQCWKRVAEILRLNGVEMMALDRDTALVVTCSRIGDFRTTERPYEGHYLHSEVSTVPVRERMDFHRGDWLIPTRQPALRYLLEVFEPEAVDSYFNWGFFDAVLQQKEWFSDYVFEDIAAGLLERDAALRSRFADWKADHPEVREDAFAQLLFIYRNSPYYESGHLRYPVYRLE